VVFGYSSLVVGEVELSVKKIEAPGCGRGCESGALSE